MELLEQMEDMGRRAKEASYLLGRLGTEEKIRDFWQRQTDFWHIQNPFWQPMLLIWRTAGSAACIRGF